LRYASQRIKDTITTAVFERRLAYWGPIPRLLFSTAPGADAKCAAAAFGVHLEEEYNAAVAVPASEAARDARHRYRSALLRSVGDRRVDTETSDPTPFCEAYFDAAPATSRYFTSPAWQALALKRDAVNRWRKKITREDVPVPSTLRDILWQAADEWCFNDGYPTPPPRCKGGGGGGGGGGGVGSGGGRGAAAVATRDIAGAGELPTPAL